MSCNSIFKRLTHGIEFDFKKFGSDAIKLKLKNMSKIDVEINQNNDFQNDLNKIHVIGEDIPEPIDSFKQMQNKYEIDDVVMENLEKANFLKPTLVQMQAIPLMFQKRELICCSYTGSGKTLAFLLPIICNLQKNIKKNVYTNLSLKTVILEPTCELARQVYRECIWFSYGTQLTSCLINNVYKFKKKNFDILITTPKRLVFLLKKKILSIENLEYLIVDECDRLFEHSLKSQLSVIYKACSNSPYLSRGLFSATFNKKLEKWFQLNLDNVVTLLIGDKFNVPDYIKQELKYVGDENGKFIAIKNIISEGVHPPVMIFCQYKNSANILYAKMKKENYNVAVIHSDINEKKRSQLINKFRLGQIWFLICTDMMSRGIHFTNISCIINYDYPSNLVTYIHRIGRTGRTGGRAITFFTYKEMEHPTKLKYVVNIMKKSNCEIPDYLKNSEILFSLPPIKNKKFKFIDKEKINTNFKLN